MDINNKPSIIKRFLSNPTFGIVASIISIVGVVSSFYFYFASQESPELTYVVHPVKTAIVRTGQTSGLSVEFGGQVLTDDITSAQIAFWNAGKRPIRGEDILSPFVIRTSNGERILEIQIRKTSRDIVGVELDSSRMALGEIEIKWNILEQDDGAILQIVYAGNEAIDLEADAVLVGQAQLRRIKASSSILTPDEQLKEHKKSNSVNIIICTICILMYILLYIIIQFIPYEDPQKKVIRIVLIVGIISGCIGLLYILYNKNTISPFDF